MTPRPLTSKHLRLAGSATAVAALLLTSACGGSSGGAKAAASPSASGGRAAFDACLRKNGVTLPPRTPGQGGGGGGFGRSQSPAEQQAFAACRSLLPNGGRFGGQNLAALAAFRTCMQSHGVTLATRTPGSPGPGGDTASPMPRGQGLGALRGLNTADPKIAAALKICRPLLPARTGSPAPAPAAS